MIELVGMRDAEGYGAGGKPLTREGRLDKRQDFIGSRIAARTEPDNNNGPILVL
jgi:hypothetical protein